MNPAIKELVELLARAAYRSLSGDVPPKAPEESLRETRKAA